SDARDALRLFILLSSEKNEPRSAAAVIGLLARRYGRRRGLRNSLRSDSPRPFSSVFLATSPPDKGGIGGSCLYSNPFALWALPLYFAAQNAGEEGESNLPLIAVQYSAYGARQGRIVIQRIFFPGQRKSLLH
ncbi:hypothetical protein, partial [Barnesiella intestinihominis]|uniref:hypothetical protein n=1 Tax=Barnesiella intestinihominis TaxID=487174 RepID=UPI003AEFE2CA